MKLHHFITAATSESDNRVRQVGKAMASAATHPPTAAVAEAVGKVEPKKNKIEKNAVPDIEQEMRDYAVDQLAGSPHHVAHHKIRHYD